MQGPDAFLLRLRGHQREPVLHGQHRAGSGRSTKARFKSDAGPLDVSRASSITRSAPTQSLFFRYGAGGRVPADHHRRRPRHAERNSFDFAVPRKSAVRRPHVGDEPARDQRFPLPVRARQVRGVAALQPRRLGAGRLRQRPAELLHAIFNYPSLGRRLRQQPDGPRERAGSSRTTSRTDARSSAARISGRSASTSATSRSRATTLGSPLGSWTFPRDVAVQRRRSDDVSDAVHQHAADLRRHPGHALRRPTCRTTGRSASGLTFNLGLRYDLQFGSFNEDMHDLLGRSRTSSDATARSPTRCRSPSIRTPTAAATATTSGRASASRGTRRTTARPTSTPRTGSSTTTCARCRTSAS